MSGFCFSLPHLFVSLHLFLALEEDVASKDLFYIVQMACDLNCTAEGICCRSPNTSARGHYEICQVLLCKMRFVLCRIGVVTVAAPYYPMTFSLTKRL